MSSPDLSTARSLDEAERLAQEIKMENPDATVRFDLCGPAGRKAAEWLDPYYGLFTVEGADGFLMVSQFDGELVYAENTRVEK